MLNSAKLDLVGIILDDDWSFGIKTWKLDVAVLYTPISRKFWFNHCLNSFMDGSQSIR